MPYDIRIGATRGNSILHSMAYILINKLHFNLDKPLDTFSLNTAPRRLQLLQLAATFLLICATKVMVAEERVKLARQDQAETCQKKIFKRQTRNICGHTEKFIQTKTVRLFNWLHASLFTVTTPKQILLGSTSPSLAN